MILKFVVLKNKFLFRNIISDAISGFLFVIIQISFFTNFVIKRFDYQTNTALIYFVFSFILSACCATKVAEDIPVLYHRNTFAKKLLFPHSYFLYLLKYNFMNKVLLFCSFSALYVIITLPLGIFSSNIATHLPIFLMSTILSFILDISLRIILGLVIMKNHNFMILAKTYNQIDRILSGAIVPLSFLPQAVQTVFFCLPFHFLICFPLEILIHGKITISVGVKKINGLTLQIILTICIVVLAYTVFTLRIKKLQKEGSL